MSKKICLMQWSYLDGFQLSTRALVGFYRDQTLWGNRTALTLKKE